MSRPKLQAFYSPQNSLYRDIVDPQNRLPPIRVERDAEFGMEFGRNSYDIKLEGQIIGEFNLDYDDPAGIERVYFCDIKRHREASPIKMAGFATYLLMAETYGGLFGSDSALSEHSLRVWRKLCKIGIAECLQEPQEDPQKPVFKFINADFRIKNIGLP